MDSRGIVRILKMLGVVEYTSGSRNVYSTCPLAPWQHKNGKDAHPSMSIKVSQIGDSVCMCWAGSCGFTGTFSDLVKLTNHLSGNAHRDAVDLVDELESSDLKARLDAVLAPEEPDEKEILLPEERLDKFKGKVPRYAFDERKLDVEACKYWELGYDKDHGRLTAPVRNVRGELVGVMGRAIDNNVDPKWFPYWHFKRGHYLYGESKVDAKVGRIILTEGAPDAWRTTQHGYKNVVALLGSRLTFHHERTLLNFGLPVYWFLDGDDGGRTGTAQCIGLMRGKLKQYVVNCPEGKDPGVLDKAETDAAISSAKIVL